MMDVQNYINQKMEFHKHLIEFIDNPIDDQTVYQNIIKYFNNPQFQESREEKTSTIHLINILLKHHRPLPNYIHKFKEIISLLNLKQSFTNFEIFDFFQNNKLALLILHEENIIEIGPIIHKYILGRKQANYKQYFYPEIKDLISEKEREEIEKKMIEDDPDIFTNFKEKRQKGQNDSKLCTLIRNDSIQEFVILFNQNDGQSMKTIKKSLFETNSFLIKKKQTLIKYAAFFGSFKIFNFLINKFPNKKLSPSLFLYAIHSGNARMIHLIEDIGVDLLEEPDHDNEYECNKMSYFLKCIKESIKCHRNEFVNYFEKMNCKDLNDKIIKYSFKYYNYEFFPNDVSDKKYHSYLFNYGYLTLVKYLYKDKKIDLTEKVATETFIYISNELPTYVAARRNHYEMLNFLLVETKRETIDDFEFGHSTKLLEIKIPDDVTSIGTKAFTYCVYLRTISIPKHITTFEEYIFESCMSLSEIEMPSSLTTISEGSFYECLSLKRVIIPPSVTSIGAAAFGECKSLTEVVIPSSVTSIGNDCFYKCISLKHITIPPLVTIINQYTFRKCKSLEEIVIPPSVTSIDRNAFEKCISLKHITIPPLVNAIKPSTFRKCTSLEEIAIPASVTSIDQQAFEKCTSLKKVTIPSSVLTIGKSAFCDCISIEKLEIPSSTSSICNNCFCNCKSLVEIDNLDLLTSVGDELFKDCSSLKKISLSSVKYIGKGAFNGCSSLQEVKLSSSLERVCEFAFKGCESLTEICFPSSLIYIDEESFSGCKSLKKISLPSSVKLIKKSAFKDCSSLEQVSFFSKEPQIREYNSMTIIEKFENLTSIGETAFALCSSLKEIDIPPSVAEIKSAAFSECFSLICAKIPQNVLVVDSNTFYKCSALKEVSIPDTVTSIKANAFFGCSSLENVWIPDSVTSIELNAFGECSSLKEISVPSSIQIDQIGLNDDVNVIRRPSKNKSKCSIY